jgi:hypothetical protein
MRGIVTKVGSDNVEFFDPLRVKKSMSNHLTILLCDHLVEAGEVREPSAHWVNNITHDPRLDAPWEEKRHWWLHVAVHCSGTIKMA